MAGDFRKIVIFELMGLFVVVGLLMLSTYTSIIGVTVSSPLSNDKRFWRSGKALFLRYDLSQPGWYYVEIVPSSGQLHVKAVSS